MRMIFSPFDWTCQSIAKTSSQAWTSSMWRKTPRMLRKAFRCGLRGLSWGFWSSGVKLRREAAGGLLRSEFRGTAIRAPFQRHPCFLRKKRSSPSLKCSPSRSSRSLSPTPYFYFSCSPLAQLADLRPFFRRSGRKLRLPELRGGRRWH